MIAGDTAFMDIEQVAQRLDVSVGRVRELAEHGELKSFMVGGELRFRPVEIEAYAQSGQAQRHDNERSLGGSSHNS